MGAVADAVFAAPSALEDDDGVAFADVDARSAVVCVVDFG